MRICLCINDDFNDSELNYSFIGEKIIEASFNDSDIIILPNHAPTNKLTGIIKDDIIQFEKYKEYQKELINLAKDYSINVIFGYDYFNGEGIINDYFNVDYKGNKIESNFHIDKYFNKDYYFSLNNNDGNFVINLSGIEIDPNKKTFILNKYYKDSNSGGAIYTYKGEIIKQIDFNKVDLIYIDFE